MSFILLDKWCRIQTVFHLQKLYRWAPRVTEMVFRLMWSLDAAVGETGCSARDTQNLSPPQNRPVKSKTPAAGGLRLFMFWIRVKCRGLGGGYGPNPHLGLHGARVTRVKGW